ESLHKVIGRGDATLYPTHGNPVTDPQPFLAAYLAHRLAREAAVLDLVRAGVGSIRDMVDILYTDVARELHKAARRSVLAHLIKLVADGDVVVADGTRPRAKASFAAV
ncbi:MAG TPA: hypothetical protein PLV68_18840, partial [Ilumatobacteraceae bacterium]|nr:hypothetical protein [Ilumatobacteraceae bacterium]